MSVKAMSMVWENSKQSGSALLMLLAIADHAKDDGTGAWPSLATLARKTRMSRRNAIEVIKKLEDEGEIMVKRGAGPRGCNIYDLAFTSETHFTSEKETKKKVVKPDSPGLVKPTSPGLVKPTSPGLVKPTSPEPSCNHHVTIIEPSEKGAAEKTPPAPAPSRDFLTDAFNGHINGLDPGVADPAQDNERWLQYRDQALAAYKDLMNYYPDRQVGKPAISELAAQADFDLERFEDSIKTCKLGGVSPKNIQCVIDTYHAGGNYQAMCEKRKNGGKPNATNRRGNHSKSGISGNRQRPAYSIADPSKFSPARSADDS